MVSTFPIDKEVEHFYRIYYVHNEMIILIQAADVLWDYQIPSDCEATH